MYPYFSFNCRRGESMRARIITALCGATAILAVCISGCASGHKQFAYVVGVGTNEVFEFRVPQNGALTPLGTPNFAVGSNPTGIAAHPSGDFLYVSDFSGNDVTLLDINGSSGNLSVPVSNSVVVPINPPNVFNTDAGPIGVVMSPTSPFLYTANQTASNVSAFVVDPGAGGLTNIMGAPFVITPASHPSAIAISPLGNFLFVANAAEGTVVVLAIGNNGVLTQVGPPTSMGAGATPNSLAAEHTGRFLYVADTAHNAILGFSIGSGGTLAAIAGSPFAAGTQPKGLAIDPQGALLYTANSGSNDVSAFVIDSSSGALGAVTGSPFPTGGVGPSAVAVDSDTSIVYVTEQGTHDIAAYGIASNGALTPVAGSPFGVGAAASAIGIASR
jgi:6-phosphogluconolactonase (cycloisomerase 2 family)